jgi:hypothetical protein
MFQRHNFLRAFNDGFTTVQHRLKRRRRSDQDNRMGVEKVKKALLSRQ